jgi:translocation and assembly module TamA
VAYHDGYLEVLDGSAEVNRGTVLVGGEWNPETGQGLIFGLEHVTFLLEGILTRWSGDVVFEPARGRLGRVVGDLVLEKGLWDQPVDFASMVLGEGPQADVVDEALYDIVLDLEVRGRGGVHVDNNLGEFDVTWNTLAVGGTAAEPSLEGEMHIAAGGVLTLSGRPIEIRQGTVRFTGVPGAEPEVEIVPQNTASVLGAGGGGGFDAEALARRGIASGLGQSLGLRNTSLAPADIALETGSETTSGFLVARQVGRYIAIFFSADLAEVQNQTALLQLYNWSKIPGLAVQVFDEAERGNGYAVFERYRWGGTRREDEQRIRSVTLEDDWPVSKRRLKKAAGLRRGQPWDPFLLFVGRMRLERELAAHGYFRAQVEGRVSEDETLPHVYFSVEPGPRQEIEFEGDSLPKEARREVALQYRPPPMEEGAFESMRTVAERYLAADDHPDGQVRVSREGDRVVVDVQRGPELELRGPEIAGLPPDVEDTVQRVLGSPVELARMVREPERAMQRVERILSLEGYRQARATSVELDRQEESQATVRVRVEPGRRATIDGIEVLGADPLGLTSRPTFGLAEGDPLRQWAIDAVVRRLRRAYRDAGYLEIEVRAEIEATPRGGWKVVVHLDAGEQKTISEIDISGRRHVSEKVLRGGMEVTEGEVADPSKIDESVLQLASFAPIERVDLDVRNVGQDAVKLDLEVAEKPRWTVGLGARWTSDYGRELLLDLRDDGLLSRGVSANLRASKGSDVQVIRLITSLPRGPGGRFSSSVTLEHREEPTQTSPDELYDTKHSFVLEGSYLLREDLTVRGYYRYQRTRTRELEPDPFFPIDTVTPVTTLGGQAILDRLDDPLNPTAGFYAAADAGWSSSKLGGELDTIRTLLTGTMALEPRTRWTWQQSLRLGVAQGLRGTDVDPAVRFFAGGQSSIRGFERDLVGPIVINDQGEARPVGGNALVILNEELRVPVWGVLRAAVFVDLGQVWPTWSEAGLDLAIGAGVGFRWDTPIGPVWGDVAWPVANRAVSEGPKYYLGIGRPF